ncbi:uncharacterized protein LOC131877088 isoform X2 [Tigriopus californicus]|uniref:uncharacterized protein LOC131877088 isoform X2 n=1 Tax=Tigriopus californicus TaxID=6832 RepID=UPI0027DA6993|nr:uncharacterized protein LOC131877088 isoform X2 [Tigriopus californicus]
MEEIKHSYEWPDEVSVTPLSLKRVSTENYAPNIIVNDILDDCIEQVCYQRAPILTPNPAHVDRSVSVEVLTSMPMVEELRDWVHPKRRFSDLDEDSIANDSLIKDRRDTVNAFSDASHCSENDLMECHSPSDRRTDSSAVSILSDKELELAPFKDTMSEGNEFRGEISAFGRSCEGSSLVNGDSRSSVEYPQIEEGLLFSDLESCDSGIKYSKYWSIAKSARKSVMNWRPNNWPEILSDESSSRMKNSIQSSETQQNIIGWESSCFEPPSSFNFNESRRTYSRSQSQRGNNGNSSDERSLLLDNSHRSETWFESLLGPIHESTPIYRPQESSRAIVPDVAKPSNFFPQFSSYPNNPYIKDESPTELWSTSSDTPYDKDTIENRCNPNQYLSDDSQRHIDDTICSNSNISGRPGQKSACFSQMSPSSSGSSILHAPISRSRIPRLELSSSNSETGQSWSGTLSQESLHASDTPKEPSNDRNDLLERSVEDVQDHEGVVVFAKTKRKYVKISDLTKVVFPARRIQSKIKEQSGMRTMLKSAIYMASTLQYMASEVLFGAHRIAQSRSRSLIKAKDIKNIFSWDSELRELTKDVILPTYAS